VNKQRSAGSVSAGVTSERARPVDDDGRVRIIDSEDAPEAPRANVELRTRLVLGIAATGLIAALVISGVQERASTAPRVTPTATPIEDITRLSEDAKWGRVWSLTGGAVVLRPQWLPPQVDAYDTSFSVLPTPSMLYRFSYYVHERTQPGRVVRSVEVVAAQDISNLGMVVLEGPGESVTIRSAPAQVIGRNDIPAWEISWSELGHVYGIQAFGFSRDELLRIAASMARVRDDMGRVQ
jgi:hypothetical protein